MLDGIIDIVKMLVANVLSHFIINGLKKLFKNHK